MRDTNKASKLWTCVIDFRGGTYIQQIWTSASRDVLAMALPKLIRDVPEVADSLRKISAGDLRSAAESMVAVEGLHGVECTTIGVGDELLLANIVATVLPAS